MPAHFVYIVRCADGSLYTGYARDPKARVSVHNSGKGARYTCSRRPVRLVYSEKCATLSAALKREYELKQWPRAKKQALTRQGAKPRRSPLARRSALARRNGHREGGQREGGKREGGKRGGGT